MKKIIYYLLYIIKIILLIVFFTKLIAKISNVISVFYFSLVNILSDYSNFILNQNKENILKIISFQYNYDNKSIEITSYVLLIFLISLFTFILYKSKKIIIQNIYILFKVIINLFIIFILATISLVFINLIVPLNHDNIVKIGIVLFPILTTIYISYNTIKIKSNVSYFNNNYEKNISKSKYILPSEMNFDDYRINDFIKKNENKNFKVNNFTDIYDIEKLKVIYSEICLNNELENLDYQHYYKILNIEYPNIYLGFSSKQTIYKDLNVTYINNSIFDFYSIKIYNYYLIVYLYNIINDDKIKNITNNFYINLFEVFSLNKSDYEKSMAYFNKENIDFFNKNGEFLYDCFFEKYSELNNVFENNHFLFRSEFRNVHHNLKFDNKPKIKYLISLDIDFLIDEYNKKIKEEDFKLKKLDKYYDISDNIHKKTYFMLLNKLKSLSNPISKDIILKSNFTVIFKNVIFSNIGFFESLFIIFIFYIIKIYLSIIL